MRFLRSFLISLNVHVWAILLLSLVAVSNRLEPEPRRIEVQLLKLPAALEGSSQAVSDLILPRTTMQDGSRAPVPLEVGVLGTASFLHPPVAPQSVPREVQVPNRPDPEAVKAEVRLPGPPDLLEGRLQASSGNGRSSVREDSREPPVRPTDSGIPARPRKARGPRVDYRVRVARETMPGDVRDFGAKSPGDRNLAPRLDMPVRGSKIPTDSAEVSTRAGWETSRASSSMEVSAFHASEFQHTLPGESAGGDTRPLIEIIQARIDAITPLVHVSAGPCRSERGIVRLRFLVNRAGYPRGFRIVASSGVRCLDSEVENVLHMAEPYPFVAGWIPVTVRFAPGIRI